MTKLRFLSFFLLFCMVLTGVSPQAQAVDPPHLQSADAVLVVDMNTDTILYELNKDTFHSIASLTKIMTCLLAVEAVERGQVKLEDRVEAQSDCLQGLDISSSNAGITPGEVMSFQDLLYCALVHSANDACNVLGTYIAGSIGAFVNMMNNRADQLGCTTTHFVDTNGMLNRTEGHYSCPYDLYLITREAMTHPLFAQVCGTADYTVSATNYRPSFDIHNSNALMSSNGLYGDGYLYDGVVGVKTGFTKPAGYCLVSVCQRREARIMAIVLGCNGPLTYSFAGEYQNFQDSATIYDWAFQNFTNKTMFLKGEPMQRLSVENAKDKGTVALCATESLVLLIPNDVTDKEIVTEVIPDSGALVAPIEAGQELGTVNVYVRGDKYASVRLTADAPVELDKKIVRDAAIHDFLSSKALKLVLISLIVLLVFLIVLRVYMKIRRRQTVQQKLTWREQQRETERLEARRQKMQRAATVHRPQRSQSEESPQRSGDNNHIQQHQQAEQQPNPKRVPVQRQPAEEPNDMARYLSPRQKSSASSPGKTGSVKIERIERLERPKELRNDMKDGIPDPERKTIERSMKNSGAPAQQEYDIDVLLETFRKEYKGE